MTSGLVKKSVGDFEGMVRRDILEYQASGRISSKESPNYGHEGLAGHSGFRSRKRCLIARSRVA